MLPILSLETSTDVCSVALHQNGTLIKELRIHEPQAHAARLAPLIQQLLKETGIAQHQLKGVAVSAGPGSYTGLRIGVSTAKGLCFALNLPLIAIPTLEIIAFAFSKVREREGLLCPMIDARRMEVYCQVFRSDLKALTNIEAKIIDENSFCELLAADKMFFLGNGAEKCKSVIKHLNAFFDDSIQPSASVLGELAEARFARTQFEDLTNFTPFYLKEFIAKKSQSLLDGSGK